MRHASCARERLYGCRRLTKSSESSLLATRVGYQSKFGRPNCPTHHSIMAPKKLTALPAGSHGAASSRRGKAESSRRGQSPRRGQASPRGPQKKSTHKDRPGEAAAQESAEAALEKGSDSEPSEIDELNKLFGRQAPRKAQAEAVEPAEVIAAREQPPSEQEPVEELEAPAEAAKEEQPPAEMVGTRELAPVEELAPVDAEAAKEEQPPAETEAQELLLRGDVRLALTALDDRLVRVLEVGDIRLVRAAWLLAQPEGYRIQRRQDLEALEQSGASPSPLLSPEEAVTLIRKGNRSAGVLSYGCELCRLL